MIPALWAAPDLDDDQASSGRPAPTLASLHFVRSALRRRWLVCILSAVLGLLAAAAYLVAFPALHEAKAALVLAHQPEDEASRAMATDVSLVKTRTLAAKAVASLGLTISPDDFLKSVTVEPVSSELLSITLTAPSDAEAVRRLEALTSIYLDFRGEQLSMQSNVYVQGIQERIAKQQDEVQALSKRIAQLSAGDSPSAGKLSDMVAQRAFIQGRIDTLQQEVEDVTLHTTSVVSSSRVIDPAATEAHAAKRRMALALASGLIGGAALGCGAVLFFAIISDRLRRRSDVAAALETPVSVSVERIAPISKRWLRFPHLRTLDARRSHERQRLAHAIETELPMPRRGGRIAVACMDNADEVCFALANAATDLSADGCSVAIIDLTKRGDLNLEVAPSILYSPHGPTVLRPRGVPELASSASDLRAAGQEEGSAPTLELSDVNLVLADLDPSVGADYLRAWTHRVIVIVTAGRSSAERVRTVADMVRRAGLELRFAGLLHTERTDDSSGTAGFERLVPIHLAEPHDQTEYAERSADEERDTTKALTIAHQQPADEEQIATPEEQLAAEEPIAEAPTADEAQSTGGQQPADEEQIATPEEQLAAEEPIAEAPTADEAQSTGDQQPADEEQIATPEEQLAAEEPIAEAPIAEAPTADEAQSTGDQQPADEEQIVALQGQVAEEHPAEEEQTADQHQPDEQLAPLQEQVAAEGEPADQEGTADQEHLVAEENTGETELVVEPDQVANPPEKRKIVDGWRHYLAEYPLVHIGSLPSAKDGEFDRNWDRNLDDPDSERDAAVSDTDAETGLISELGQLTGPSQEKSIEDGWYLYTDQYPPAYAGPVPSSQDEQLNWDWDWEFDDLDSDQDSAVIGADEVADVVSNDPPMTTSENGKEHPQPAVIPAEKEAQEADRPAADSRASNGQVSNGQRRQRTGTRSRRRRSRRH